MEWRVKGGRDLVVTLCICPVEFGAREGSDLYAFRCDGIRRGYSAEAAEEAQGRVAQAIENKSVTPK